MSNEVEKDVPGVGKFVLIKAKAGPRNKALINTEGAQTDAQQIAFAFELLPHCIKSHPFEMRNLPGGLKQALDEMEGDDYDVLLEGFKELYEKDPAGDAEKKSDQSSTVDELEQTTH